MNKQYMLIVEYQKKFLFNFVLQKKSKEENENKKTSHNLGEIIFKSYVIIYLIKDL